MADLSQRGDDGLFRNVLLNGELLPGALTEGALVDDALTERWSTSLQAWHEPFLLLLKTLNRF